MLFSVIPAEFKKQTSNFSTVHVSGCSTIDFLLVCLHVYLFYFSSTIDVLTQCLDDNDDNDDDDDDNDDKDSDN